MVEPTLIIAAVFSLTSAGIYFYVGHSLSRRHVASQEARLAWNLFVTWWYALGVVTIASGVFNLLGAAGITDVPLFLTFTQFNVLAVCIALFSLVYYILYLFTGNRKTLVPLAVLYTTYYVILMYYVNLSVPTGVSVGRWSASLAYQQQPAAATDPLVILIVILLIFPQVIAGIAYFTLYFRVKEATQKYRVAMVSWSIIIWFLSAFIAAILEFTDYDWWQIASRLIGLSATLAILMAYRPIPWIKQRLGVASIAEESA